MYQTSNKNSNGHNIHCMTITLAAKSYTRQIEWLTSEQYFRERERESDFRCMTITLAAKSYTRQIEWLTSEQY